MLDISTKRVLISGALMALWVASLVPQADVVNAALGNPPGTYSGVSFPIGLLLAIPQIPGLIMLGILCTVFRSSCDPGGLLNSDWVSSVFILLGNAAPYMIITLPLVKAVRRRARVGTRTVRFLTQAGIFALLANVTLLAWMLLGNKPYYAHPRPVLSVLSLVIGVALFYSLSIGNSEIEHR